MDNTTVYIDKEQFSKRLQELFYTSKCKAVELENSLKVGRATVSRWRNGHTLPDNSQVKEIAQFFGVRYEWLIGRDEYKTVKDIPFNKLTGNGVKRFNYLETLGYTFTLKETLYEEDENGDLCISGGSWIITKDGVKAEISDEELIALEKEIGSFIDYKMAQLFSK